MTDPCADFYSLNRDRPVPVCLSLHCLLTGNRQLTTAYSAKCSFIFHLRIAQRLFHWRYNKREADFTNETFKGEYGSMTAGS